MKKSTSKTQKSASKVQAPKTQKVVANLKPKVAKEAQYDENGVKMTQSYFIRKFAPNGRMDVLNKLAEIYECDLKWAKKRLATFEKAYGRINS